MTALRYEWTPASEPENATLCRCGKPASPEAHPCPYAEEIGRVEDPDYCNCCDECRGQCAMDI